MGNFFLTNKTKITGAIIVLVGFFQLTDNAQTLKNLMGDEVFAVWNLLIGGLVVVLGFWNTSAEKAAIRADIKAGGFARTSMLVAVAAVAIAVALTVVGCAGTKAAYSAAAASADPAAETAYVVAEQYAATLEQVAKFVEGPTASPSAKASVKRLEQTSTPVVLSLHGLRDAYLAVKSAENAKALQAAVDDAITKVAALLRGLKTARGVP